MADTVTAKPGGSTRATSTTLSSRLATWAVVALIDVAVVWFVSRLLPLGFLPLAGVVVAVALFVNVVLLLQKAYPIRWMVVGLVLMTMFTLYPIVFTVWVAMGTPAVDGVSPCASS